MSENEITQLAEHVASILERAHSPWCSRRSAAAYMDCAPGKIDQLANRGEIKRHWLGSDPRFKKADLDRYLETHQKLSVKH